MAGKEADKVNDLVFEELKKRESVKESAESKVAKLKSVWAVGDEVLEKAKKLKADA